MSRLLVSSHRVPSPPIGPDPTIVEFTLPEPPPAALKPDTKPEPAPTTEPVEVNTASATGQASLNDVAKHKPPPPIETALAFSPTVDDPFEADLELQYTAPAATAVEPAPQPIEEMTVDEVIDQVANYREWCEQGQLSILLQTDQLTNEQFDSLVEVYVLRDLTHAVFVNRAGRRVTVDESAPRAGFEGALPGRSRWPNRLRSEAVRQFGPNHAAKASFQLAPRPTLELYRLLIDALGTEVPPPGTRVTLSLMPNRDGTLIGEVIDVKRPRLAAREKPPRIGSPPIVRSVDLP